MKKVFASIIILLFVVTSCKKGVLEKVPLDIISDATVWSDPILIDAYLNQVYSEMYIFTNDGDNKSGYQEGMWFSMFNANELSDEAKANWFDDSYNYKFGNLRIEGGLFEWWPYNTIRKLNEFIERVPNSPIDQTLKARRVAEARFLRAFAYFGMVKRYGGVPLITAVQNIDDPEATLYPKREKEEVIYSFILSEIDAIVQDLPPTVGGNDLGRPSRYAAMALQCRAALYAGSIAKFGTVKIEGVVGIDPSKATVFYQKAFDVAQAIKLSNAFSLYNADANKTTNYRNLFLVKNNVEVMFAKRHNNLDPRTGGAGWGYDFFQSPAPQAWGAGNQDAPYLEMVEEYELIDGSSGKFDRVALQQGLYTTDDLFKNKDPRFKATIYTQNTPWKGRDLQFYKGIIDESGNVINGGSYKGILSQGAAYFSQIGSNTGFGVLKYLDEGSNADFNWGTSSQDYMIFRYGEVLLNLAEAAFELNLQDDALKAVNEIRDRAGIKTLTSVTREQIRHERKVELAFEGHRYWDLRRWRQAVTELSKQNSGLQYILDYTTRKFKLAVINQVDGAVALPAFYERNYYLPITISRTANNRNLVENPGYKD